jgi:glutamine amidotransferase
MCEIFAISSRDALPANAWLEEFYSHSHEHPDGWGIAWHDEADGPVTLHKGPEPGYESAELAGLLASPIAHPHVIAHIRRASQGIRSWANSHPFVEQDANGRTWVVAHNGVVMNDDLLPGYDQWSAGETDSEWVVMFLLDVLEEAQERAGHLLSFEERFNALSGAIALLSAGNMLNLVIDDGTYLYAHTNTVVCSLHSLERDGYAVVSTQPLDDGDWKPMPVCRLVAWRDGERVAVGPRHVNCSWSGKTLVDYLTATGRGVPGGQAASPAPAVPRETA